MSSLEADNTRQAPSGDALPATSLGTMLAGRPPPPPLPPGLTPPGEEGSGASAWLGASNGTGGPATSSTASPGLAKADENKPATKAPDGDVEFSGAPPGTTRRNLFPPYLDEEAVRQGLASGALLRGTVRVNGQKPGVAFVKPDGAKSTTKDFVVRGKTHRNRSVHGDIVIVQLVGRDDGRGPQTQDKDEDEDEEQDVLQSGATQNSDSDEEIVFGGARITGDDLKGRAVRARSQDGDEPQLVKVVAISDPKGQGRVIVCTLHPNDLSGKGRKDGNVLKEDAFIKAVPTDKRMPTILLQVNDVTRKVLKIPGRLDKYQMWPVTIVAWKESSTMPLGRLKGQCIGKAGTLEAEERHALIENELDDHDVDFVDEELDEVDNIVVNAKANFDAEVKRRHDLRSWRIFTIDPATARDLDDAIHVDTVPGKDQIEIGVHIADVGHFLKLGSITDTEAQRRTTSVYLINRVLPMLPHGLCNHLCSLNPNEPKLAFSAFFRLERSTGELVEDPPPWFEKTAISSCCRLNYEEAQQVLDGEEFEAPPVYGAYTWQQVKDDIFLLYEVCGKVREGRMSGGAINLHKTKMVFHTRESEDGTPSGYHLESHSASHWVIEELMLLANRCVAKHLATSVLSDVAILRNHKGPDEKKSDVLVKLMRDNLGIKDWDMSSSGRIYSSCQRIYERYGSMLGLCVEMMTMRAGMKQAEYFVFGDEEQPPHHFALNFDYYTHFTSPIRRYPDVMVHRALAALIEGREEAADPCEEGEKKVRYFQTNEEASDMIGDCNGKKTASRRCQEQMDRAVFCIFLRSMKQWFYTVGSVLAFHKDTSENGRDAVTVYCSQLGRESKARLCTPSNDPEALELFMDGVEDELMLPESFRFRGRGAVELEWKSPAGVTQVQSLKTLSCVPIVIIPTNTVPIDYALFFVSPFHPRYQDVFAKNNVNEDEVAGFDWHEDEEEGVDVVHNAFG